MKNALLWLAERGSSLLTTAVVLVALFFAASYFMERKSGPKESHFVNASESFAAFTSASAFDPEALNKLSKELKRHPELHSKYDGPVAVRLLTLGEGRMAEMYAVRALKRVEGLLSPYHSSFSKDTLAIAFGDVHHALEGAKALKNQLSVDISFREKYGELLYAFTLLRIALLEKEVGNAEGELLAWKEFEENVSSSEVKERLQQGLGSRETSLNDFILHRKRLVSIK